MKRLTWKTDKRGRWYITYEDPYRAMIVTCAGGFLVFAAAVAYMVINLPA